MVPRALEGVSVGFVGCRHRKVLGSLVGLWAFTRDGFARSHATIPVGLFLSLWARVSRAHTPDDTACRVSLLFALESVFQMMGFPDPVGFCGLLWAFLYGLVGSGYAFPPRGFGPRSGVHGLQILTALGRITKSFIFSALSAHKDARNMGANTEDTEGPCLFSTFDDNWPAMQIFPRLVELVSISRYPYTYRSLSSFLLPVCGALSCRIC